MKFENYVTEGWPKTFDFNDSVKPTFIYDFDKAFCQDGMVIPLGKVNFMGCIKFEMKIVSEKLDEVAKDENVESGVEDSETEEK